MRDAVRAGQRRHPVGAESRVLRESREARHEDAQLKLGHVLEEYPVVQHRAGRDDFVARERKQQRDVAPEDVRLGLLGVLDRPLRLFEAAIKLRGVLPCLPRASNPLLDVAGLRRLPASGAIGVQSVQDLADLVLVQHLQEDGVQGRISADPVQNDRLHRLRGDGGADVDAAVDPADRGAARAEQVHERLGLQECLALAQIDAPFVGAALHAADLQLEIASVVDLPASLPLPLQVDIGAGVAELPPNGAAGDEYGVHRIGGGRDGHARQQRLPCPILVVRRRVGERLPCGDRAREQIRLHRQPFLMRPGGRPYRSPKPGPARAPGYMPW